MKRGTPEHPKVDDLREILRCSKATAVGYLELLWHFTAKFAPQGDIGRYSDKRIEGALDWSGRGGILIGALVDSKWIDRHSKWRLLVHDWRDHADDSVRKRLSRGGLQFVEVTDEVTGQCPDTDRKVSATQPDKNCLPLPEPVPEPEPNTEEPPKPPAPLALAVVPRNGHRKRGGDRTSEEIRKALGPEREKWWDSFWKIYPCREGMKAGMDAFERRVTSRELAVEIYHGAERYAQQAASDPSMKLKYAQGWINGERWKDENRIPPKNSNGNGKVAGSSVMQRPKHETTEEELIEAHLQQASSINDVEGREYSIKWLSEKGIQPYAKAN